MAPLPEEIAFQRFRETGDPAAMAQVFDRTAPKLLLVAMHFVRDAAEAEDLVQTTFVQAIAAAPAFDPGRPLLPWLTSILANRARDLVRGRARRPRDESGVEDQPGRERDPLAHTLDAEVMEQVTRAIDTLPEPHRHVLVLRLVHGLRAIEVAHALGQPPGTVRMQLKRALALLRAALPKGLGVPAVLWLGSGRGLAAVRHDVLAGLSLSQTSVAGATLVLGGALMLKKVLLVVAVVVAASTAWLWVEQTEGMVAAAGSAPSPPALAQAADQEPRLAAPSAEPPPASRELVASAPAPAARESAVSEEPVLVEPYDLRLLAVDKSGLPVADAVVTVRDGKRVQGSLPEVPGIKRSGNAYSAPAPDRKPIVVARTDEQGRAVLRLDREMVYFDVTKEGGGRSGPQMFWWSKAKDNVVMLHADVRLRGVVLRPDGTPASSARVEVRAGHTSAHAYAPEHPPPATTDAAGRFELPLLRSVSYVLQASDGELRSDEAEVYAQSDQDVVLRFPGGITVRGLLFDPDGKPVSGTLKVWELVARGKTMPRQFRKELQVAAEGKFELPVPRFGSYQLLAQSEGLAATQLIVAQVDETRPHADVNLHLLRPASIDGRVVDARGDAVPGAEVVARPAKGDRSSVLNWPGATDLYGRGATTRTAGDGTFRLAVHPRAPHEITCTPDAKRRDLRVLFEDVEPGTTGLLIVVADEVREGSTIELRVVDGRSGAPVREYVHELALPWPGGMMATRDRVRVAGDDGCCTLADLGRGRDYQLTITADGYASLVVPVHTDRRTIDLTLRLVAPGAIRCLVKEADGKVAVGVNTRTGPIASQAGARFFMTDSEGRSTHPGLEPGRYRVAAFRGGKRAQECLVDVRAGETVDVELTFAK